MKSTDQQPDRPAPALTLDHPQTINHFSGRSS
jgi:hypothetical protein